MVTLGSLWLPIVLSAVIVFAASFIAWMVSPHHKTDWRKLPDEESIRAALLKQRAEPGQYHIPYMADMKEMKSPEMIKKMEEGPVGFVILKRKGMPKMGAKMFCSFLYNLAVSFFVAYLAAHSLALGTPYLAVFRIVGTAAILAYSFALFPSAIWFGRTWGSIWKEVLDGIIYGLLTAGTFGWLWPR